MHRVSRIGHLFVAAAVLVGLAAGSHLTAQEKKSVKVGDTAPERIWPSSRLPANSG